MKVNTERKYLTKRQDLFSANYIYTFTFKRNVFNDNLNGSVLSFPFFAFSLIDANDEFFILQKYAHMKNMCHFIKVFCILFIIEKSYCYLRFQV